MVPGFGFGRADIGLQAPCSLIPPSTAGGPGWLLEWGRWICPTTGPHFMGPEQGWREADGLKLWPRITGSRENSTQNLGTNQPSGWSRPGVQELTACRAGSPGHRGASHRRRDSAGEERAGGPPRRTMVIQARRPLGPPCPRSAVCSLLGDSRNQRKTHPCATSQLLLSSLRERDTGVKWKMTTTQTSTAGGIGEAGDGGKTLCPFLAEVSGGGRSLLPHGGPLRARGLAATHVTRYHDEPRGSLQRNAGGPPSPHDERGPSHEDLSRRDSGPAATLTTTPGFLNRGWSDLGGKNCPDSELTPPSRPTLALTDPLHEKQRCKRGSDEPQAPRFTLPRATSDQTGASPRAGLSDACPGSARISALLQALEALSGLVQVEVMPKRGRLPRSWGRCVVRPLRRRPSGFVYVPAPCTHSQENACPLRLLGTVYPSGRNGSTCWFIKGKHLPSEQWFT